MTETSNCDFSPGDVILHQDEAYQVHENLGKSGMVAPFPAVDIQLMEMQWDAGCRKIGNEPLPEPSPCASGGRCPSK